ncbi:MAG: HEAT repeat domain-containing protein, partial [Planctomycetota bacterium]
SSGDEVAPKTSDDTLVLASINQRLEDLEQEIHSVANRPARDNSPRPSQNTDEGSPEPGVENSADKNSADKDSDGQDLAEFHQRLARLETVVRTLSADPVERGYNYLSSENPKLRRQGMELLESIAGNDPEARQAIRDMLRDGDSGIRVAALDTLADLRDKDAMGLVPELLADESASVRSEAITTLARLGAKESGGQISEMLADADPRVRERAADALGDIKYGDNPAALIQALDDKNNRVKGEVIASLGEAGVREAAPKLRDLYNNDPGEHKYRLMFALKSLGDQTPYNSEVQRLSTSVRNEEDAGRRIRSIRTLAWIARDQSKQLFEELVADENQNSRVREEAKRALYRRRR